MAQVAIALVGPAVLFVLAFTLAGPDLKRQGWFAPVVVCTVFGLYVWGWAGWMRRRALRQSYSRAPIVPAVVVVLPSGDGLKRYTRCSVVVAEDASLVERPEGLRQLAQHISSLGVDGTGSSRDEVADWLRRCTNGNRRLAPIHLPRSLVPHLRTYLMMLTVDRDRVPDLEPGTLLAVMLRFAQTPQELREAEHAALRAVGFATPLLLPLIAVFKLHHDRALGASGTQAERRPVDARLVPRPWVRDGAPS
ncbi:MAG: hypothetical protein AB7K09_10720 [Planctomycetota bacterium]